MSPTEFAIMTDVWSHWWSGDSLPWPSVSDVAEHLGKSVRQVRRYLKRMQESGWVLTIAQSNSEGRQLSNRYDFTPFLRKLVAYLESIKVLEKPTQEGGEGDTFTRERVTLLPGGRVTLLPPESDPIITDSSYVDESIIRDGAERAELEKESVLSSRDEREAIRNETGTDTTNTSNNEENEHSNHENNENKKENGRPAQAKDVDTTKSGNKARQLEKMAAAMGVNMAAVEQMEAWLKACEPPTTFPVLTAGPDLVPLDSWMSKASRSLGDTPGIKANITQVTKIYLFAQEHGLIDEEYMSCLSRAHGVAYKRHKKGELRNPPGFFFRTLKLEVLATLAVCGEREVPPPVPVVESEQQELVPPAGEVENEASKTNQAAPGAQVPVEAEQLVEVLVTNDPAVGFSSHDITIWWADRLLDDRDPERQLYRYQVYPTNAGRWGFVVFEKEDAEKTWTFLSHHQVNEALRPPEETGQD